MDTQWRGWLVVGLLWTTTLYALAEEISLTTYYPSPKGAYQTLSSTSSSHFATYEGGVGIGAISAAGGTCPAGTDWYDENNNALKDAGECKPTALYATLGGTRVGIGTTNPGSYKLDVVGGDIHTTGCFRDAGGSCISDAILKRNVQPLTVPLEKFLQLQPVTYEWDREKAQAANLPAPAGTEYGLLAQEVERVFPELVSVDGQGYKRVQYGIALQMLTIQALKEQQAQIQEQQAHIKQLQADSEALKAPLVALERR